MIISTVVESAPQLDFNISRLVTLIAILCGLLILSTIIRQRQTKDQAEKEAATERMEFIRSPFLHPRTDSSRFEVFFYFLLPSQNILCREFLFVKLIAVISTIKVIMV